MKNIRKDHDKKYALQDHLISSARGIFSQLSRDDEVVRRTTASRKEKKSSIQKMQFNVITDYRDFTGEDGVMHKNAIEIVITTPAPLSASDESCLLELIHMSTLNSTVVADHPVNVLSDEISDSLFADTFDLENLPSKSIRTIKVSRAYLMDSLRFAKCTTQYKRLEESIHLLSMIHISYKNEVTNFRAGQNLLSYHYSGYNPKNKDDQNVYTISLNWRLSGIAIDKLYQYTAIDLNERHQLKHESSKILHTYLSSHTFKAQKCQYLIDSLIKVIWPTDCDERKMRDLRYKFKKTVIPDFESIGWEIEENESYIEVTKPHGNNVYGRIGPRKFID